MPVYQHQRGPLRRKIERTHRYDTSHLADVPSIPERVARRLGEDCIPTREELLIADETIELATHRLRQQYLERMRLLGSAPRYDETDDD